MQKLTPSIVKTNIKISRKRHDHLQTKSCFTAYFLWPFTQKHFLNRWSELNQKALHVSGGEAVWPLIYPNVNGKLSWAMVGFLYWFVMMVWHTCMYVLTVCKSRFDLKYILPSLVLVNASVHVPGRLFRKIFWTTDESQLFTYWLLVRISKKLMEIHQPCTLVHLEKTTFLYTDGCFQGKVLPRWKD